MANIDLSQYGITGTTEIVYNPSYELLFKEETDSSLEGIFLFCASCSVSSLR